jgi:PTH1 family peptidyl-tRNA hydrolase
VSLGRIIVGLGNPGAQYERTRHNLGFMVVDLLARESSAQIRRKECRALVGRAELDGIVAELVKPQTFMNLSGESVACIIARHESDARTLPLIVISDDLALPFGTIRIRTKGSAGGHNGLKSIIAALRSDEFIRLRIGIQPDHPISDAKHFVLDEFSKSERAELDNVLERSAGALRSILRDGVERAMAQYNG